MKKHLLFLTIAALAFSSCSKELTRVNTNPNNLENADAGTLMANTIVQEFYQNANVVWTLGNGYDQYMTFSTSYYDQSTRYSPVTNESYWIPLYESARDANTLYTLGQTQNNPLLQAVALTLRSYAFAQLTELWGDIPFLQALQGGSGIYTPKYDSQETVYTDPTIGVLASLRRADSLLAANATGLLTDDLLYSVSSSSPSVTPWRRFINALRLRYLLRVSAKMDVSSEMQSIVTNGVLMQSATNSAVMSLPTTTPYNFVSLTERTGDFAVKFMNSLLYNTFVSTGDSARISGYFATTLNTPANSAFSFSNYGGLPMVVDATSAQTNASSNFNASFVSGTNKPLIRAKVMTYAEQQFILAEAALKGLVAGDAATYYNSGVVGAYAECGIDGTTANAYLGHSGVTFDNSTTESAMSQIITQKWIANINNAFEGWIEFRRTGYPAFDAGGSANLNGGAIPTRFLYPTTEQSVNSTNYKAEVQQMGGTEITTYKAWWEK